MFRDETTLKDEDMYDIFNVDLLKKPGKGLGLSIVGKRNDVGVFISDIVSISGALIGTLQHLVGLPTIVEGFGVPFHASHIGL